MVTKKLRFLLLAVTTGFAAVLIWMVLIEVSSALALEGAGTGPVRLDQPVQQQPPPQEDFIVTVVFTDPASIEIKDLSGSVIGEGEHVGEVRCNFSNCNQKTQLSLTSQLTSAEYEYRFTTRQALDPEARILVVAGSGKISNGNQKQKFQFTATFHDNGDGTVSARYEASRPEASFIIPNSRGSFLISRR
jgi:hypothetical protein